MVVWGLMVNSDDKPVWPDPVRPCCIFTVSQGIAATVTARPDTQIETERGAVITRGPSVTSYLSVFEAQQQFKDPPLNLFTYSAQHWPLFIRISPVLFYFILLSKLSSFRFGL